MWDFSYLAEVPTKTSGVALLGERRESDTPELAIATPQGAAPLIPPSHGPPRPEDVVGR